MAGNKRKVQEVNAGSMADIAFLLLIFFLVATTMNKDFGINRVLPPYQEDQDKEMQVKERNLFQVLVNRNNAILANSEEIDLSQLGARVKEFLLNRNNDPELPEIESKDIENLGRVPVSKGIVSLQNDRGTHYEVYIAVQNELTKVFNELRNDAAMRYFSKKFDDLNEDQQKAIVAAVPIAISEAEPRQIQR